MATPYAVLFRDHFDGEDGKLPHRGKWMTFLARSAPAVVFTSKIIEISSNKLHLLCEADAGGTGSVNVMTRAEFKLPFTFEYRFTAVQQRWHGELNTPDMRDGFIEQTTLYGKWLVYWFGESDDNQFNLQVIKDGAPVLYDSGAVVWALGIEYKVHGVVTAEGDYDHVALSFIRVSDSHVMWQQEADFDKSAFRTLRLRLIQESANNIGETLIDNVKVWGVPSRKAEARVTVTDGVNVSIITEDVVDATVQNREDAYSSASLSVRNPKNKYSWITPISEIEIVAGNESVMWLLFRGYIEAPKRSYPPAMLSIESSKGYNKRLDFREAYDEAYEEYSGVIVVDLLEKYFPDLFTEDHVALGEVMNVTYQASSIAKILKELADANGFVAYIDFNKDLHFADPVDEQSQSNLLIQKEGDVIQISVQQVDEIINKVRQEGAADEAGETIVYTAEDPDSEDDYWTREHTFKDSSLVDAASVQLKAEELVAKNASLITEVDVALPQIEPLEIYDLLTMTFEEVNLDAEVGVVKSIRYVYGAGGVRTDFKTHHRGYFLADTLAKLHNIVSQMDIGVHNVPPAGNGELPPPILPPELSGIMTMRTDVGTFASPMFIESVDCDNSRLLPQPVVESLGVVLTPTAVETAVESLEVGITPKATETMSDTAATTKPGTTLTRETGVGSSSVGFAKNTIVLQRVQANLTGTLTKLTVYGLGSADGSTRLKGVLYSDVSGAPSALLATGAEVTPPVSAGWIDLTGFSYAITSAAYYWIGFMVGPNTAGTHNYTVYYFAYQNYHWTAYKAITYPTGPNPITTPSYYDYQLSIYGTATTNT